MVGDVDGSLEAVILGRRDGAIVGEMLGSFDGNILGVAIGSLLGIIDGFDVTTLNGPGLGNCDGPPVGMVGNCVGSRLVLKLGTLDVAMVGIMLCLLNGNDV